MYTNIPLIWGSCGKNPKNDNTNILSLRCTQAQQTIFHKNNFVEGVHELLVLQALNVKILKIQMNIQTQLKRQSKTRHSVWHEESKKLMLQSHITLFLFIEYVKMLYSLYWRHAFIQWNTCCWLEWKILKPTQSQLKNGNRKGDVQQTLLSL